MHVEKIAQLARLKLTHEEREALGKQLQNIIDFVYQLQEVNTENVEPYIPVFSETPMREDEPKRDIDPSFVLRQAPNSEGSFFVVPRVIEY